MARFVNSLKTTKHVVTKSVAHTQSPTVYTGH